MLTHFAVLGAFVLLEAVFLLWLGTQPRPKPALRLVHDSGRPAKAVRRRNSSPPPPIVLIRTSKR
jgi:hypothetical protein